MAGRFARGFLDCGHHSTGGGVHGEGPTVVELHCLSAAGYTVYRLLERVDQFAVLSSPTY